MSSETEIKQRELNIQNDKLISIGGPMLIVGVLGNYLMFFLTGKQVISGSMKTIAEVAAIIYILIWVYKKIER